MRMVTGTDKDEMVVEPNGGTHHRVTGRFDLLPYDALRRAAIVMENNLASHGKDTWRLLTRSTHVNHALAHLSSAVDLMRKIDSAQTRSDDRRAEMEEHLEHAMCRILFANSELSEDDERNNNDSISGMVYVSFPFSGGSNGREYNTQCANVVARIISLLFPSVSSVFVPHNNFAFIDEDTQRDMAMRQCCDVVRMSSCMLLVGDTMTPGMIAEAGTAVQFGIPIFMLRCHHTKLHTMNTSSSEEMSSFTASHRVEKVSRKTLGEMSCSGIMMVTSI